MSDMVEKMARAICRRYIEGEMADGEWISPTGSLDGDVEFFWKDWVGEARAAIEAMREPTEEMERAGDETGCFVASDEDVSYRGREAGAVFTAMIDSALSTKGE